MAKRDPNRIQVDLKLLQDKNLRALQEFGDQFSRSVDRLTGALERGGGLGGGGLGGAGNTRRPGTDSGASEAPTDISPGQKPATRGANWLTKNAYAGPDLTEFEKAQFNLGNIGQMDAMAQMRYMSHLSGRWGWNRDGSERNDRRGVASRAASGMFGTIPRGHTYLQSARGIIGQVYNAGVGPASFGQNLGRSRQGGFLGTPIMSRAWRVGVGANLDAGWRSWFGFNPNYTTAQAKEAMQTVNQYGYDGHLANRMLDTMKNVTETTGLDASSQMQLLDPAMRFGTDSMQGVVDTLYQIPRAANAARMSVSQFTADLTSAAQQLADSTNMTMAGATKGLMAFSGATGLAPSKGAGILNDQRNLWMTSAMTGKNLYQLTFGTHAMSDRMKMPITIAEQMMGAKMSDWHKMAKTDPAGYQQRMSNLIAVQMQDPSLFGGMNVKDLVNLANHSHRLGRMNAEETLQLAGSMKHDPNWNALMQQMGASETVKSHFRAYQSKLASEGLSPHEQRKHEADYLRKVLGKLERNAGESARGKTYFDLTPPAKRLLRFMDKTVGKTNSNAFGDARSYAEHATQFRR